MADPRPLMHYSWAAFFIFDKLSCSILVYTFKKISFFLPLLAFCHCSFAQKVSPESDTFFLLKKKGLLGKLGKSITTNSEPTEPVKTVDLFKQYQGKIIRSVTVSAVGFNNQLNDHTPLKNSFVVKVTDALHSNSTRRVIEKNLFFKKGQPLYPLVIADNERFLREQPFLRDALITVFYSPYSNDSVDIVVLTRDVFSIGGRGGASGIDKFDAELSEENIGGSGDRFALYGLYDKERTPGYGWGAEYVKRNIKGSFINWSNGILTFDRAFNSGRMEERTIYSKLDKPMASRYTAVTGAAEVALNSTTNAYIGDSLYNDEFKYSFFNVDFWVGYNIGYKGGRTKDSENRLRHFVAARGFYNIFQKVPDKYVNQYNFRYADIKGGLLSYSLYRQNFYRTNFIYGFGRNEDVPEGVNASVITGYTNKQGYKRPYLGLELEASKFRKNGSYNSFTFKSGAYRLQNEFQDIDFLIGMDRFTKLNTLNKNWFNRNFMSVYYTRQINPFLNEPLFIQSEYGLPYVRNGLVEGETRTTFKMESVFYNLKKIAGFRFAPFVFTDFCLIQFQDEKFRQSKGYPAFGGGVRTRNENLVFGTIELRGYVFPRIPDPNMEYWKVEVSTKLRFKFNSNFIKRPEFISPN